MKKSLPIIVLVLLAVAAWYFSSQRQPGASPSTATSQEGTSVASGESSSAAAAPASGPLAASSTALDATEGTVDMEVQPASRAFKTAAEALEAVKKGATEYDDTILEQFTMPGEDCTWCPEFYKDLRDMLASKTVPTEQLSYYSELLAISGKSENVAALISGIKNPASEEQAQAFSEALELTIGNDQITIMLAENIGANEDERLRESSVAAITNQGSRLAAEILYKNTVERGDPDGYYSMGTGLGELVPNEETLPYLQELLNKRDTYSHLAAKSLANGGLPGLKMVFDSLSRSNDVEGDRAILKDLINHLNYEEEIENYLKDQAEHATQPALREFAQKSVEAMQASAAEDTEDGSSAGEDQYQTPLKP